MMGRESFTKMHRKMMRREGLYLDERGCVAVGVVMVVWFLYLVTLNELADFLEKAGWPPAPISYSAPATPAQ